MPPKPRAFVVTLVWGERADLISTSFWIANDPSGAVAQGVQAALRQNPQLPGLIGCGARELTEENVVEMLRVMQSASGSPQQLEFVKPEGSA